MMGDDATGGRGRTAASVIPPGTRTRPCSGSCRPPAQGASSRTLGSTELDDTTDHRMAFLADMVIDAASPTNNLLTNPSALKKAFDTGGVASRRGPTTSSTTSSATGACRGRCRRTPSRWGATCGDPGQVVYRNELMELISTHPPRTPSTRAVAAGPSWIASTTSWTSRPVTASSNGRSHCHTVFVMSYRNPHAGTATCDSTTTCFAVRSTPWTSSMTSPARRRSTRRLCLGGTLTAALLAYLASKGEDRVNNATLLNTPWTSASPVACAFTDRASVEQLERRMGAGLPRASEMMGISPSCARTTWCGATS